MPSYDYKCSVCEKTFEEFHSINETIKECPFCKAEGKQSPPPQRLISGATNFILVGGGWAREGYNK